MTSVLAERFIPGSVGVTTRFALSESAVDRFAVLTGDRSSLHVSLEFARRSVYRARVAHGMLPLLLLAVAPAVRADGWRCVPKSISARFVSPVFCEDSLELHVVVAETSPPVAQVAFDFLVVRAGKGETVTEGRLVAHYEPSAPCSAASSPSAAASVLVEDVALEDVALEALTVGRTESFEFCITEPAVAFLHDLLAGVVEDSEQARQALASGGFDDASLLAVALLSTLVGMRLPGRSATFIEFSAAITEPIRMGSRYRLDGRVAHVSRAASVVKTDVAVRPCGGREAPQVLSGRVTAVVNRAAPAMPSAKSLRDSVDLGLRGKVVLVTGASRGIGETTAKLFALCGARVIVNYYRGKMDAERIVAEISEEGAEAIAIQADVRDAEQVRSMVGAATERFGGVDVLVNNAVGDYRPVPWRDLSWEDVQRELDVTVRGAMQCCQAVIPSMLQRGGGKIVAISSVAVELPPPDQLKYVIAKSALEGLMRSLAAELAPSNIQVNIVAPNFVETDLVGHVQEGFRNKIAREVPMGRHATPVDVARAVVFLASSYSAYTTGQRIMVTGGQPPYL